MDKNRQIPSRPALGKGLASLLPSTSVTHNTEGTALSSQSNANNNIISDSNKDRHPGISMCLIDEIVPNEFQPRKTFVDESLDELAQSIKINGLIQPLIVRRGQKGGYQLIAGERRWRAAKIAGIKQVPIVIKRTTDKEALELALIENIQREELNCFETALAYYQLITDFDLTQEVVAERMGKDRSSVANHLRLLKLPQYIKKCLQDGLLSFGHGKALAGVEDQVLAERVANLCVDNKWSVRDLEAHLQKIKDSNEQSQKEEIVPADPLSLRMKSLSKQLSDRFSTKVNVRGKADKGKIIIEYFSNDDLERVLNSLLTEGKNS